MYLPSMDYVNLRSSTLVHHYRLAVDPCSFYLLCVNTVLVFFFFSFILWFCYKFLAKKKKEKKNFVYGRLCFGYLMLQGQ